MIFLIKEPKKTEKFFSSFYRYKAKAQIAWIVQGDANSLQQNWEENLYLWKT